MITAILALFIFILVSFKGSFFRVGRRIESKLLPQEKDLTISTMTFSSERIVYYQSIPNSSLNQETLEKELEVQYVSRGIFDTTPMALQVYLGKGSSSRLIAELLEPRFDLPVLDSLYGEKKITQNTYQFIRKYKFAHPSTKDMLKKEVIAKLLV